jgi:CubicO group peptidase (beta-lactamase class C family)
LLAALSAVVFEVRPQAQAALTSGLFERYVEALRQEYGIPGMSVVVLQNGAAVTSSGFGFANVAGAVRARDDTPYPIANLTETIGAAVTLRQCMDYRRIELDDRVVRWSPFPDGSATFANVLGHMDAAGRYDYNPSRFALLGEAASECAIEEYPVLVAELLNEAAMTRSVPGREVVEAPLSSLFVDADLGRYRAVLADVATPYRVTGTTATRSDYSPGAMSAADGVITTAVDLARFHSRLDEGLIVSRELLQENLAPPAALGWFVYNYNGAPLLWHYGVARDAYSSLVVKVPSRRLTLIMLANSDRLATSLSRSQPDPTVSVFVKTFLRIFVG